MLPTQFSRDTASGSRETYVKAWSSLLNNNTNLSDFNWTRTQNRLVLKRTLNHLAKPLVFSLVNCEKFYFGPNYAIYTSKL